MRGTVCARLPFPTVLALRPPGGRVRCLVCVLQVKKPSTVSFLPLREALRPEHADGLILPTDFAKLVSPSLWARLAVRVGRDDAGSVNGANRPSSPTPGCAAVG